MKKLLLIASLFFALPFGAAAQTPLATAKIADLGFFQGAWQGTFQGGPIETYWSAPAANNLMGSLRMIRDGKIRLYEILVLEQTDAGVTLLVRHFQPGLVPQEEKDRPDRYVLIEQGADRAVFEKVGGDPVRVIWERRPGPVLAVARGTQKDGQWNWADLFLFKPAR